MNRSLYSYLMFTLVSLAFLPGCLPRIERNKVRKIYANPQLKTYLNIDALAVTDPCPKIITIWIHGTRLFSRPFFPELFNNVPSFKQITTIPTKFKLRTLSDTLVQHNPDLFDPEHFYIFGWSGKLSFSARLEAARALFKELVNLLNYYEDTYCCIPQIRIITHSHGGNVALNLARVQKEHNLPLAIDELILLACPVQIETKELVNDPLFKKIVSLYSSLDLIQILDPQGLHHRRWPPYASFFSERRFPEHEKLMQAKIKMNKRAISHHEFISPLFLKHFSQVLTELESLKEEETALVNNKSYTHLISLEPPRNSRIS